MTAPTALPDIGIVMVMAGSNDTAAAPVSCTSTAPDVKATSTSPICDDFGTPIVPEKVAVESAGAVNVKEGVAVRTFVLPSAFFAVMVVLGGNVTETPARYPGVPGAVATVVALAPVVALPSGLTVAAKEVVAEGITGAPSPPPPHPPAIIKAPRITPYNFNNLTMLLPPISRIW